MIPIFCNFYNIIHQAISNIISTMYFKPTLKQSSPPTLNYESYKSGSGCIRLGHLQKENGNTIQSNRNRIIHNYNPFGELNQRDKIEQAYQFKQRENKEIDKKRISEQQKFDEVIQINQNQYQRQKKPQVYSNSLRLYNSILPGLLFSEVNSNYCKKLRYKFHDLSNKIIHQAKTTKYNYPKPVEQMIQKFERWKSSKSQQVQRNQKNKQNKMEIQFKEKLEQTGKIPYPPRFGTNQGIYWCFNQVRVVIWRYPGNDFTLSEILTQMTFQGQREPITAICVGYVSSKVFKKDKTITICVGLFDKLRMFIFLQDDWKKDRQQKMYQFGNQDLQNKYYRDLMLILRTQFTITSLTMKNIFNQSGQRSIIIVTDDGEQIQVVDLNKQFTHRSEDPYNLKKKLIDKLKFRSPQIQKTLQKLIHFQDANDQSKNYCVTLTKKTSRSYHIFYGSTVIEKVKNFFKRKKQIRTTEEIISIFEWNDRAINNVSYWKKIRKPADIMKINSISSEFLQNKLKSCFNQFFQFNDSIQMRIADIELVDSENADYLNHKKRNLLKVLFTNGTFAKIQNLSIINFQGKIQACPSILPQLSTIGQNYREYLQLLDKNKFLLSKTQMKKSQTRRMTHLFELNDSEKLQKVKARKINQTQKSAYNLLISQNHLTIASLHHIYYILMENIKIEQKQSFVDDNLIIENLPSSFNEPSKYILMRKNHLLQVKTQNPAHHLIMLFHIMKNYPQTSIAANKMIKNHFQVSYSSKINLFHNLFTLIMKIDSLGLNRTISKNTLNKSYDLNMAFHQNYSRIFGQIQETQQQKKNRKKIFDQYVYKITIDSKPYTNLIQSLVQKPIQKLNQRINQIQRRNSIQKNSYQIYVNTGIYSLLWNLLFEQGLKNSIEDSTFVEQLLVPLDDPSQMVLEKHPISNIAYALTIYISELLNPIFNVNYIQLPNIRREHVKIAELIQQFQKFLVKLLRQCNQKSSVFNDTNAIINQLKVALYRIKTLLKLLDALGQENLRNQDYRTNNTQITLRKAVFDPQCLKYCGKLAVRYLFDNNNHMLDQIQEAFPELELKFFRFYQGWKKMNRPILENKFIPLNISQQKHPEYIPRINQAEELQSKQMQIYMMSNVLTPENFDQIQNYYFNKRCSQTFVQIVLRRIGCIKGVLMSLNDKIQYANPHSKFSKNWIKKIGLSAYIESRTKGWLKFEEASFMKVQFKQNQDLDIKLSLKLVQLIHQIFDLYIREVQNYNKNRQLRISQRKSWDIFVNNGNEKDHSFFIDIWITQLHQIIKLILNKGNDYFKLQLYRKIISVQMLGRFFVKANFQKVLNKNNTSNILQKKSVDLYNQTKGNELNPISRAPQPGSKRQIRQKYCDQLQRQRFPLLKKQQKSVQWPQKAVGQNRLFGTSNIITQKKK